PYKDFTHITDLPYKTPLDIQRIIGVTVSSL
ncbi:hypothetical protein LINPERPRIM_LOCUS2044, partial [Linum perenne]